MVAATVVVVVVVLVVDVRNGRTEKVGGGRRSGAKA